jgi:GAF domain-containing protein
MSEIDVSKDGPFRSRVIEFLRSKTDRIVELWTVDVTSAPYTRIADFSLSREMRAARLRSCLEALLELAITPGDARAREHLRITIRSEHIRSIGLVKIVSNHHALRRIAREALRERFEGAEAEAAERFLEDIVDLCVEETVILVEQYIEAQRALSRSEWNSNGMYSEPEQVFASFCRNTMEYFDADLVALFRLNRDIKELTCVSCFAKGVSLSRNTRVPVASVPLVEWAVSANRPVSCLDREGGRGERVRLVGGASFEHCIAVPLSKRDEVTGILFIGDNGRASHFTPEEVGMAEEFSKLVVGALDSADSFRMLSFRSRAQRALIETAANMQQEIDSEEIYRILASKIVELIPSHEVAFYVFDWQRNVGNPVYATGAYADEIMADRDFPPDVGIVGVVAKSRRAEIIADTEVDPRAAVIPDTPATHTAMLAVPVLGRKEVLGVIELLRYLPEGFVHEELEIAVMFANHAAVALENAGLLKEMTRVRDEVELHMDLLTHDIANYSTPLMGYLETLRRGSADKSVQETVDKTISQVENISRMVSMVRTLAKLRSTAPREFKQTDLRVAIELAVSVVKSYSAGARIEMAVDLPETPMPVFADELLPELFISLFFTAVRPGRHDKAKLLVRVAPAGDGPKRMWAIEVIHPDRSITDELKKQIMRVAKTSKSELSGGFGIGLASARGIAERYSGRMWISDLDPKDPEKGCVFNLRLPRAS